MLTNRLLRRATQPPGVIDTRAPQERHERAVSWTTRHLGVAAGLWARHAQGDEGGSGDSVVIGARVADPVAADGGEPALHAASEAASAHGYRAPVQARAVYGSSGPVMPAGVRVARVAAPALQRKAAAGALPQGVAAAAVAGPQAFMEASTAPTSMPALRIAAPAIQRKAIAGGRPQLEGSPAAAAAAPFTSVALVAPLAPAAPVAAPAHSASIALPVARVPVQHRVVGNWNGQDVAAAAAARHSAPHVVQRKAIAAPPPPDIVWRRPDAALATLAPVHASWSQAAAAPAQARVIQRQVAGSSTSSLPSNAPTTAPAAPSARQAPATGDLVEQAVRRILRQLAVEQERRGGTRWR